MVSGEGRVLVRTSHVVATPDHWGEGHTWAETARLGPAPDEATEDAAAAAGGGGPHRYRVRRMRESQQC